MTQALIPIVNKIQEAFAQVRIPHKLDLPQIAVVGSQSAGKSSVIENIVGRDFLPRGSGIVTRRPLILQLTNLPIPHPEDGAPTAVPTPWAEFAHQPGRKFFDFREVRSEIAAETDRETGTGKAVSAKPIILKVYAADVVNLTLVDLPGLTKVPVGDQPPDIEVQIRAMVLEFINKPACIILAVSPANVDIANSDALKLAREVDPEGVRTIGVLTKLDLMDKGTDAREILEGKAYPLRRGFIGIVNRSQQAIETMVDIGKALRDEEDFFQTHPVYRSLASRCGTAYLARTLNAILLAHIRETLPELRSKISDLIVQTEGVLAHLGGDSGDERSRGGLLLQLLAEFERGVIAAIDGSNSSVSYTELKGGARISYIFSEAFVPYLQRLNPTEGLQEEHIRTAICNSKGARNGLFIPEAAFESLIHRQIARLEDPGLRCCDHVFEELAAICEAQAQQFNRFPDLRVQVGEFCIALLRRYMPSLRGFVSSLVAIELAHVNTHHPDFFGGGNVFEKLMTGDPAAVIGPGASPAMAPTGAVAPGGVPVAPAAPVAVATMPPGGRVVASGAVGPAGGFVGTGPAATMRDAAALSAQSALVTRFEDVPSVLRHVGTMSATERKETEVIKILIKTYFDIVRKTFADQVPKAVVHFLVNKLKDELHGELVATFYKEELFAVLLRESDDISAKRKAARAMLQCLRQAQGTLAEVKDARVA